MSQGSPNATREWSFQRLIKASEEAAKFIVEKASEGFSFVILCHIDCDGLASGAIIGKALTRLNVPFQIRAIKQFEESALKECLGEARVAVLTDMGSSNLNAISKLDGCERIIVLDHHQPVSESVEGFKGVHVNPHLFKLNGAIDISSSGVAYITAKSLNPSNIDLSPLAVVGAVGDMQNRNEERRLVGFNEIIVKDAVESGLLKVEKGLTLAGSETKRLHESLALTLTPFIPGISGEEDKALAFLASIDIPVKTGHFWRTPADLAEDEEMKLLDNLTAYMASKGVAQEEIVQLVGESYILTNEQRFTPLRDCREYSALLNACGRLGKYGLGIAIAMGDRSKNTLEEAYAVLNTYRKSLATLIESVVQNPSRLINTDELIIVNGSGLIPDSLLSTVASILSSNYVKPLIAFTDTPEGMVKVSARAPRSLVNTGVNIAHIVAEAALSVGGSGGGHDVAAGALIPFEKRNDFLRIISSLLRKQQAVP
ncbi:MAG: DHH family phosphoesterase [Candidatus Bathyarchaeia archaeon]